MPVCRNNGIWLVSRDSLMQPKSLFLVLWIPMWKDPIFPRKGVLEEGLRLWLLCSPEDKHWEMAPSCHPAQAEDTNHGRGRRRGMTSWNLVTAGGPGPGTLHTTPFRIHLYVNIFTPGAFRFLQQVPASLCSPASRILPGPQEFVTSVSADAPGPSGTHAAFHLPTKPP